MASLKTPKAIKSLESRLDESALKPWTRLISYATVYALNDMSPLNTVQCFSNSFQACLLQFGGCVEGVAQINNDVGPCFKARIIHTIVANSTYVSQSAHGLQYDVQCATVSVQINVFLRFVGAERDSARS